MCDSAVVQGISTTLACRVPLNSGHFLQKRTPVTSTFFIAAIISLHSDSLLAHVEHRTYRIHYLHVVQQFPLVVRGHSPKHQPLEDQHAGYAVRELIEGQDLIE